STCPRHPVMYRYSDTDGTGAQWRLDTSFPDVGRGFVGAVAYIPHTDEFLAVGGDGCYPRREEPCPTGAGPSPSSPDPIAGKARAWLFDGTTWQELTPGLPPRMLGMTALDFSQSAALYHLQQDGVAGALGQLWLWQDGRFLTSPIDASSAALRGP